MGTSQNESGILTNCSQNESIKKTMRVVGTSVLQDYARSHADSTAALIAWLAVTRSAEWRTLIDVRRTYPAADFVNPYTVFNLKGNKYRLVTLIDYSLRFVRVCRVMTHSEYDKDKWK
jgi:mRNA interferase HigB